MIIRSTGAHDAIAAIAAPACYFIRAGNGAAGHGWPTPGWNASAILMFGLRRWEASCDPHRTYPERCCYRRSMGPQQIGGIAMHAEVLRTYARKTTAR